jgi:2'-deoxynucleoside 5'-phosphate N-hydrolase
MQIYFAGSISGGREFIRMYQNIVNHLKERGHTVPTEHVAADDVLHIESSLTPEQIYQRDIEWLSQSHAMIAEVSRPSLGVGYEIGYALSLKKPVLCLVNEGVFLSRMITGNRDCLLSVKPYTNWPSCRSKVDHFMTEITTLFPQGD